MGFELDIFKRAGEDELATDYVEWLVDEHSVNIQRHFGRLWEYYANPMIEASGVGACERKVSESGRCYVQAQEYGLPARITGLLHLANAGVLGARPVKDIQRKEVVIENDIAWRINAAVDFLFGKPISFVSRSPEKPKRAKIEAVIKALFAANGGISFFQDMAVLGSVYGFVDCFVRPGDEILARTPHSSYHQARSNDAGSRLDGSDKFDEVLQLAQSIGLELVEAAVLLAKAKLEGEPQADLDGVIEQLKREKQYLFAEGSRASASKKTSGVRDRVQNSQAVLERAAEKAATTGNRADLQEYLKLRRSFF